MKIPLTILLSMLLVGCASRKSYDYTPREYKQNITAVVIGCTDTQLPTAYILRNTVAEASRCLIAQLCRPDAVHNSDYDLREVRLLVTTCTDLRRIESTNRFGRLVSEELGNALHRDGATVIESRLSADLRMQPDRGETMLSREIGRVMNPNVNHVVTGTYTLVSEGYAFTVKILDMAGTVRSSVSFTIPASVRGLCDAELPVGFSVN